MGRPSSCAGAKYQNCELNVCDAFSDHQSKVLVQFAQQLSISGGGHRDDPPGEGDSASNPEEDATLLGK